MADSSTAATPGAGVLLQSVTNTLSAESRVALASMEVDQFGTPFGWTALRDKVTAQRYTILADSIADGFATFWTSTVANGGTTAVTLGEGLIQTSANANGSAQIVSTAPPYYPGQVHWLNSAIRFGDLGVAANVRRIGAFTVSGTTPQDGFAYELSGTTLNAVTYRAGVATAVASTSWSQFSAYPFTLTTSYHQFEIRWTANSVQFHVDNVLRHSATGGTIPISNTLNYPITIQTINTASAATNQVIAVRNIGLGRFGAPPVGAFSPDTTMQNAAAAVGNGATLDTIAYGAAVVQVTGTFVATITFEGTADGTNYVAIPATLLTTSAIATTATTTGVYRLSCVGLNNVRARISAFTSGTVTALGRATSSPVEAVAAPAITKATQGAIGFTTQDIKDAGRVIFSAATVIGGVAGVTAEALLTMVPTRDGTAAATATTQAVTSGKRLRLMGIMVGIRATTAAVFSARVALRMNPSGAVAATSPILCIIPVASGPATAETGNQIFVPFPNGIEFSGTHQFGLTQLAFSINGVIYASLVGFEY